MTDLALALARFANTIPAAGPVAADYALYADYYAGQQRMAFATDKFRSTFGRLFATYSKNFCARVVDAVVDRLRIVGFGVEGKGDKAAGAAAWTLWTEQHLRRRAREVHTEALTAGDAYVQVWPDAGGVPRFYVNSARLMTVLYDEEQPGLQRWAAKTWTTTEGLVRLTLYYPDRIEKYATARKVQAGADLKERLFVRYIVPGEAWPLVHNYGQTTVFHFANRARVGAFGQSDLAAIIPVQDELNKAVMDMMVAMEIAALQQRYVTGWEPEIDKMTGRPSALSVEPGSLWAFASEAARVGEFTAANLQQFLAVQDNSKADIARISGVPMHYLMQQSGSWPSGESIKIAEAPFTAKVEAAQDGFGPVWGAALAFALTLGTPAITATLSPDWKDPEPRSEATFYTNLDIKRNKLGVPEEQIWHEADYTTAEIAEFKKMKALAPPPPPIVPVGAAVAPLTGNGLLGPGGMPPPNGTAPKG